MKRDEIIKYLDQPISYDEEIMSEYDKLKECIRIKFSYQDLPADFTATCREIDMFSTCRIDDWFRGIIHSLYYRPNHNVMVLSGENQGDFFRDLFPQKELYIDCHSNHIAREEFIYDRLVIHIEFFKNTLNIAMEDNFVVTEFELTGVSDTRDGYEVDGKIISTDKRLASYCSITNNWTYPPRKDFIVLNVTEIDWELFNSIDKHLLWIEIFNRFKPLDK